MRLPVFGLALTATAVAAAMTACGSSGSGSASTSGSSGTSSSGPSSSTTSTTTTTKAAGACELLTTDEVTKAVGATFEAGRIESTQDTPYGKYTVCVWTEKGHALNAVRVSTWEKPGAYDSAKNFDKDAKESTGIGEKSFVGSFASVYAVVDGHTLFVQYYSPDGTDEAHLPISTSLAKTASARL